MINIIFTMFFIVLVVAGYVSVIRPWQLHWGATDEELARSMAGDDIVKKPVFDATRAVTVNARPEDIWPWLVQIGIKRAGWYSYDWIDNLGKPSAEQVIPEFQHIVSGDLIPMSPDGKIGLWVKEYKPYQWILWWDKKNTVSWLWNLCPVNEAQTRLITRVRMNYHWFSPVILFELLLDVGDIIMMRKCMLGIKRRAEILSSRG
jgi:hypothetical protein